MKIKINLINQSESAVIQLTNQTVPTESFETIDPGDSKYKNVRVILVTANCSRSGVTNPVDFIVNEGEGKTLTAIN
jgi:hypothetical protein